MFSKKIFRIGVGLFVLSLHNLNIRGEVKMRDSEKYFGRFFGKGNTEQRSRTFILSFEGLNVSIDQ